MRSTNLLFIHLIRRKKYINYAFELLSLESKLSHADACTAAGKFNFKKIFSLRESVLLCTRGLL